MEDMDDDFLKEIINELINEANEGLDQLEQDLLALEEDHEDKDVINRIFRTIHTIKGSSGAVGFNKIQNLAHKGETLLDLVRSDVVIVTPELISAQLELMDALRENFADLEANGVENDVDYSELEDKLHAMANPDATPSEDKESAESSSDPEETPESPESIEENEPIDQDSTEEVEVEDKTEETPNVAKKDTPPAKKKAESAPSKTIKESFIKVDVKQLDSLMNMVGELVLARNQIIQQSSSLSDDSLLVGAAQRLNIITSDLQQNMMKTRMQPVESAWTKFPRVVRDLCRDLNKNINLVMEGKETELDRSLIEAIKDPLMHIIRNSCDHGAETKEERAQTSKPDAVSLILRAYHESGLVVIEIIDDGRGVNIEKVKAKAVRNGVITQAQSDAMGEREAANLIFNPGLSTAEQVSNVSGRGVGMDVVKSNIEKIGGSVDLQSEWGKGTNLKIKIPLTLAIIPALIVTSAGERFAIPQMSLLELVRLDGDDVEKSLETVCGTPVYRLRGNLLPLVYLNEQLKLQHSDRDEDGNLKPVNIVVLQAEGVSFGLVVDEINDSEEIVVKPLSKHLKDIACFAGATIMGDGKVALILDTLGIAHTSQVLVNAASEEMLQANQQSTTENGHTETLLLFRLGESSRMAIQLSKVSRIEEFPRDQIQIIRHQSVIQYRDQILTLVDLANYVHGLENVYYNEQETVQVIVYSVGEQSIGIIVSEILDIVEHPLDVGTQADTQGIIGSYTINDYITEVINAEEIMTMVDPQTKRRLA